jgi:hypothetical protein
VPVFIIVLLGASAQSSKKPLRAEERE